jgi:hypothetical protein
MVWALVGEVEKPPEEFHAGAYFHWLFGGYVLLMSLVMSNLLIAKMNSTYDAVKDNAEEEFQVISTLAVREYDTVARGGAGMGIGTGTGTGTGRLGGTGFNPPPLTPYGKRATMLAAVVLLGSCANDVQMWSWSWSERLVLAGVVACCCCCCYLRLCLRSSTKRHTAGRDLAQRVLSSSSSSSLSSSPPPPPPSPPRWISELSYSYSTQHHQDDGSCRVWLMQAEADAKNFEDGALE